MMFTQAGLQAVSQNSSEYLDCINSDDINKYRVIVNVETDIQIDNIESLKINDSEVSIYNSNDVVTQRTGYKKYQIIVITQANWHHEAESFVEKYIYDFFSLNGAYISVVKPFEVHIFCKNKWYAHPTGSVSVYSIQHRDKEQLQYKHETIVSFYRVKDNKKVQEKLKRKVEKLFNLLKRGILLKNDTNYSGESFLCFYRIVEIVADDLKATEYEKITYPQEIIDLRDLGLITDLRSQKMRLYLVIKIFKIGGFKVFDKTLNQRDLIKLADTRNQLSHTDKNVDIYDLESIHFLSTLIIHSYIDLLDRKT